MKAAVFFEPGRVIAFAAAREGVPTWIAMIKGVWLALGSGYKSTTGNPALDTLLTRGGMDRRWTINFRRLRFPKISYLREEIIPIWKSLPG